MISWLWFLLLLYSPAPPRRLPLPPCVPPPPERVRPPCRESGAFSSQRLPRFGLSHSLFHKVVRTSILSRQILFEDVDNSSEFSCVARGFTLGILKPLLGDFFLEVNLPSRIRERLKGRKTLIDDV